MATLTPFQRASYEGIVTRGEATLARWSASNPMRAPVQRQVDDARRQLGVVA